MAGRTAKTNGPSILDQLWNKLDDATNQVMTAVADPWQDADEKAQGRARGLAEAIFIASYPIYHDVDTVVGFAVQRHGTDAAFSGSPSVIHHAPPDGVITSEEVQKVDEATGETVTIPAPPEPGKQLLNTHVDAILKTLATGVDVAATAALTGIAEETVAEVKRLYGGKK